MVLVSLSHLQQNQRQGAAKNEPIMSVLVQDDGEFVLEYGVKLGNSIEFRVGGTVVAFMERADAPVPDSDMFVSANASNVESLTVEYEHALSGPQKKVLGPGQRLTVNAIVARHWKFTAPNWE